MSGIALVRKPGPRISEGIVTHLQREPVDPGRALDQHQAYVAALEAAGWRPEVESVARAVRDLGLKTVMIARPGTLDGGDVLQSGPTVYVGRSARTDDEGIRQLAALLPERRVVPVNLRGVLHLKSAVTALPDGTLIGDPRHVDLPGLLVPPEEPGATSSRWAASAC
ncbi:N(G),N(G)-dimethylarginine dimethylaminohydrolase [Nonomuraea coxensis DSM 45129]|uniref:N(G),N(G)-dimethylarginine dimethylaminohydrolase n=1 Tax=Nonomuraea coxensis DSM 45129 TaxID=1122611 RepID=A0ABX8TYK1_9ACTN|nr:N(G),N(G)-dimethylarginine dimethylaminohydrolase [Nonomuraea coxensis DSM 45129]